MTRYHRPKGLRNHPTAHAIALELAPLIGLRTRRLVADVIAAKGVGLATANKAVSLARAAA